MLNISRHKNAVRVGPVIITASRWPWQIKTHFAALDVGPGAVKIGERYGWKPAGGMGRFGGGWNWSLGIRASATTIYMELLFGSIQLSWHKGSGTFAGAVARYEEIRMKGKAR